MGQGVAQPAGPALRPGAPAQRGGTVGDLLRGELLAMTAPVEEGDDRYEGLA